MEKYLAAILLATSLSVSAETKVFNLPVLCTNPIEFAQTMETFGEFPLARGNSVRAETYSKILVIFMNPNTRTFTIAEKVTEDVVCVVAIGDDFEPLDENGDSIELPQKDFKGT